MIQIIHFCVYSNYKTLMRYNDANITATRARRDGQEEGFQDGLNCQLRVNASLD